MSVMGYGRHFEVVGDVLGDDDTPVQVSMRPSALRMLSNKTPAAGLSLNALPTNTVTSQRMLQLPPQADWRSGQLAPGVMAPDEGMVPLPLTPLQNGGLFAVGVSNITFQGQLQKPYRAERVIATTAKTIAAGTGPRILAQFFVGTDLQMADIAGIDIEAIGAPTAFGTRMTLLQAPPGVLIRVPCTLTAPLTGTDTILLTQFFLGRVIH